MVGTRGRIRWTGSRGTEVKHVTYKALYYFFKAGLNQEMWLRRHTEIKQLGRVRGGGRGSKLSITVACSLVADKKKSSFPREACVICQGGKKEQLAPFLHRTY